MDAMKEASQSFVIIMELIEKAGEYIANVTGAEASLITSGSFASLVLGTAASILRGTELSKHETKPFERLNFDADWRDLMQRYPEDKISRREVLIQKTHRNEYDYAIKIGGGKLVEVGTDSGCFPEELEEAISEKTALILVAYHANLEDFGIPLNIVIDIAHRYSLPVMIDAAMKLLPRMNLKKFISEGAYLVVISGGKHVSGPNDTGFLCGRKDLIKLATLLSAPYRGLGRGMKVDRTQIVGLIKAIQIWLEKDEEEEYSVWVKRAEKISKELEKILAVMSTEAPSNVYRTPIQVHFTIKEDDSISAEKVILDLRKGDPSIWVNYVAQIKSG